jgi:purine-binding chemotaxis protein CheW
MSGDYLTFVLDEDKYGIPIDRVRQILEYSPVTVVPNVPACIRGVVNLRGAVVPVVDLAAKFGLRAVPVTKWTCLVVVNATLGGDTTPLAIVADMIDDVVRFTPEDIAPPPSFGTPIRFDYLVGLGRVDRKFVMLLKIDLVLTLEELMAAAETTREAQVGSA